MQEKNEKQYSSDDIKILVLKKPFISISSLFFTPSSSLRGARGAFKHSIGRFHSQVNTFTTQIDRKSAECTVYTRRFVSR